MKKLLTIVPILFALTACDAENVGPQPQPPLSEEESGLRQWCTIWHACGTTPSGGILTCCDNWCYSYPWCVPTDLSCMSCDNDLIIDGTEVPASE